MDATSADDKTGTLILVGAPLGNAADASTRMRETLAAVDIIAAEDTRRLARLARDLDIPLSGRLMSYFEGNESRRTPELVEAMRDGARVAVVTDGGMPSVSDPGFRLVRAALDAGIPVGAVPGPSAVTTAVALSGLPSDRFCFEGFPPRRPGARRTLLATLAAEPRTLVFFEAPHRVAATLADLVSAFGGERQAALCREMTKVYEEVRRSSLSQLADWAAEVAPRGEITLVVAGATAKAGRSSDVDLLVAVTALEAGGMSRRDAVAAVASDHGVSKRHVYALATAAPA